MVRLEHEVSLTKEMHNFIEIERFSPYERRLLPTQTCFLMVISSSTVLKVRTPKDKTVFYVPWTQAIHCFETLFLPSTY